MARQNRDRLWVLGAVLLAALVRLDFLVASNFVVDADEAIVGLMAQHIAVGRDVPTFYYGQHYMGSLEPILASFLFRLFGSSAVALKAVPFLWSLLLIPLLYWFGRQLGGVTAGRIAAYLGALPPQPLVVWSAMARGGFIELVVIGAVALWLTIRWARKDRPTLAPLFFIAVLLGIGWWVNNQIIFFILPIGLAVLGRLWHERHRVGDLIAPAVVGSAGFFIGGLPFWVYNITHDFITFGLFRAVGDSSGFGEQLQRTFSVALPMLWGARRFWQNDDLIPGLSWVILGSYGFLLLIIVLTRLSAIGSTLLLRFSWDRPVELFLLFWCSCVGIFAASSFGNLVEAPRYLLPAYVGSIPLIAYGLSELGRMSRKLFVALTIAFGCFSFISLYWGGRGIPGEPFVAFGQRVAADHRPLVAWLRDHSYQWVRTNYWIGYRLAFETSESVRFLVYQEPTQVRIPEYISAFAASGLRAEEVPLVLVPAQEELVRRAYTRLGIEFESETVGEYRVIHKIKARPSALKPVQLVPEVIASINHDAQTQSVDGDVSTRWGSAAPQRPGMAITLSYPTPVLARGLRYEFGAWPQDAPQGLQVVAELEDGSSQQLVSEADYRAIKYSSFDRAALEFRFPPVVIKTLVLTQTGSHPLYDWSVAELRLLE